MIVLIINGAPQVGKDEFIKILSKHNKERVVSVSSIDWIKKQAQWLGWDGVKDKKGRQFLSDLKDVSTKYNDGPFKQIIKPLKVYKDFPQSAPKYFCTCIREPKEITKLRNWCTERKIECYAVWIRRKVAEQKALDENFLSLGDTQFAEYNYDRKRKYY